ncbi:MAG TPA: CusA/CzcA family heavy metal efflux RND transporter [Anaeromyxobacteraceae bacterium]|jgi:cobalt-zinc-cadmium resistance protein CzcA|nr:CusA/CzcA family heavy metal efflux RND transporter [Anaeromyxobacteraceae bacterium]
MIDRFVSLCLRKRWLVLAVFCLLAIFGWLSFRTLAVEAYPDIADTSAQVITQHPGHAAEEVEEQITVPLERELNGTPGLSVLRSRSTFGLSLITMVFKDGVDDYWARTRIRERLAGVELPEGATPQLDPLTSAVGEIYRYTLESKARSVRDLTELQTWTVIPALKQVPGIADVSNFGGETTEFQIALDPARLAQFNLSLQQVIGAIKANNANAGGSLLVRGEQAAVIRGIGLIRSLEDLGNVVVASQQGTPVFLKSLGQLQLGALTRNGIAGKDGAPDVVTGIVLLLRGENPSRVLDGIHAKVDALNHGGLPADVRLVPYLDRTELVGTTVGTVSHTLLEGMGLVILVLLLFLGSGRAALLVAVTVPLALLISFVLMAFTNIPANLLSLGAIDFGILVDGAIVVLESVLRRREQSPDAALGEPEVREAAAQVARPMFFATAIIITAYLPLFAFQRVERKLFSPMAWTVGYALAGALLVALAVIPALSLMALRRPRPPFRNRPLEWLRARYERLLAALLASPRRALAPGLAALALAAALSATVGKEYLPELDEGSLWLQVMLPPGVSLEKASEMAGELRRATRESPEVRTIVTQLGRTDDGMDPWTPSHIEAFVGLRPYSEWPSGMTKRDLVARLEQRYKRLPGVTVGFSQPIFDMVNDKIAGAHSELVVKVYGRDFEATRAVAGRISSILEAIPGAADVTIDQEPPLPQLQIEIDRAAAARFGINVSDISDLIEIGVGGRPIGAVFQGERRYDVTARYLARARATPQGIGDLMLTAPDGQRIPLSQVARISLREGESTITRESNRRHLTVRLNLRGRDLSSFLAEADQKLAPVKGALPAGVELSWGGQFEDQNRAQARLAVIVPVALALIFLLLYGAFGTLRHAALILASVPLALLGGMAALHLRGMTLNVSSAVGFIALFGVAVQNGVIMVSALNRARDAGLALPAAVLQGACERLRPVLLTATVAALGLLPAALARGIGSDVQRPLATVVVGGLLSATLLTLVLLPVLYLVVERRFQRGEGASGQGLGQAAAAAVLILGLALPGAAQALGPAASAQAAQPAAPTTSGAAQASSAAGPASAAAGLDYAGYLARVLQANPDLGAAREAVAVADAQIAVAKVFPDPELTAGATQVDVSRRGNPTIAGLSLSVPIELGGKRGARVAVARSGVTAAQHDLQDATRTLRASAANAFADALHARLVQGQKERVHESLTRLVAITEQRLAAGDVAPVALLQSRVEARQFQAEVLAAAGERRAADAALLQLLGAGAAGPDDGLALAGDLRTSPAGVEPARVLSTVASRADVLAAQARVEQAERQVKLEEAKRTIDLTVGAGWSHNFPVSGSAPLESADTVSATLGVPLPFSRVYRGELDAALAGKRQAERQLESVRAKAESELRQALARFEAAAARVALYESGTLSDADAVLEKTLYNYQRGGASLTDYLVAQRTASDVQLAFFDALADRAHALAGLEAASGLSGLVRF